MNNDLIKQNVLKLQQKNATPDDIENYVRSAVQESKNAPKNPSLFQEVGQNLKSAWNEANAPQDLASPLAGGGHIANAFVNTPVKHAFRTVNGLLTKIPGVQEAENYIGEGVKNTLQNTGVSDAVKDFSTNNPRTSAALGGLGNMVNAGLTVSTIGQGLNSVRNSFADSQARQGVTNTLSKNLNYSPVEASNVTNTIANTGNAAQHLASGNINGALAVLDKAAEGASGAYLSELQEAIKAVTRMGAVNFVPTTASSLANVATGLIGGAKNLAGESARNLLKWSPVLATGAGLAKYFSGKAK